MVWYLTSLQIMLSSLRHAYSLLKVNKTGERIVKEVINLSQNLESQFNNKRGTILSKNSSIEKEYKNNSKH